MAAKKQNRKNNPGKVPHYDIRDFNNDFNRINGLKTPCHHQAYNDGLVLGFSLGLATALTCFVVFDIIKQPQY